MTTSAAIQKIVVITTKEKVQQFKECH